MGRLESQQLFASTRFILKPVLAVAVIAGFIAAAGAAESGSDIVASDASLSEVMATIIMPATDVLWNAIIIDVTDQGIIVATGPDTEEGWQLIKSSSETLAASTDKLLNEKLPITNLPTVETPPGELGPQQIAALRKDQWQAWTAHVQILHELAVSAAKLAEAKDAQGLSEISESLDAACTSCHQQFWYPEA